MESLKGRKLNLVWITGLTCNGNTHSFLSARYDSLNFLLDRVRILYHPSITSDVDFKKVYDSLLKRNLNLDFLIVEGAVSKKHKDVFFQGYDMNEILNGLKNLASYIIAVGNCASFGNFPATRDKDIVGLSFRFGDMDGFFSPDFRSKSGYPVINIPGCPIHPTWLFGTLQFLVEGKSLKLDKLNRPKEFFMYLTHDGCIRNQYFEWKVETEEFGTKEGCLFYHLGCRGPLTHSTCNKILWNDKSSKTRAGMPCVGCTEFDFPLRERYFQTKLNIGIPEEVPLGVSKRAYLMLSGVAKTFTNTRLKGKLEDAD